MEAHVIILSFQDQKQECYRMSFAVPPARNAILT